MNKIIDYIKRHAGVVGAKRAGLMALSVALSAGAIPGAPLWAGKWSWVFACLAVFLEAGEKNAPPTP